MNCLDYTLKLFNMTQQELADLLGIKQQNIDLWIRDSNRKIPKKHLPKLAEVFKLPEDYFQKEELTELDKLEIQRFKLDNEWIEEEYEDEIIDPITEEYETVKGVYEDSNQQEHYNLLEYKIDEAKTINRLKQTLAKQFDMAEKDLGDDEICTMDTGVSDAYQLLYLYKTFINIIEKGGISRNTLKSVLESVIAYQTNDLEKYSNIDEKENDDVKFKAKMIEMIGNTIKKEEYRLREKAKQALELIKEFGDF